MAGCVSITAACDNVEPLEAILIGILGALFYKLAVSMSEKYQIDDPLNVSQVHGFCGLWGVIATGLFDKDKGFYHLGDPTFMGIQCIGALAIIAWTSAISFLFFKLLKKSNRLRIGQIYEILGMDIVEEGQISQWFP